MNTHTLEAIKGMVDALGGARRTAQIIGVSQPTVTAWYHGKHGISPRTALRIEKITGGQYKALAICQDLADALSECGAVITGHEVSDNIRGQ